ncbi:ferrichrome ABC transporter permease [Paenibacillus pectinilyticus]|uniref:Ferrichrome ABC transporter permease n=1 Tax=Paenibacillus pectinilyticus TaxID=512399 RepID=A0A1C0ZR34_9BACL|nr:iron ABC transporter permease [Paenibacillus pectinilyticus]OCT10523.1 ferrichrome ABC transporter permease [Paenibacillus pectinilyticus]
MGSVKQVPTTKPALKTRPLAAIGIIFGGLALLLISLIASISVGAADISFGEVWQAIFHFNGNNTQHLIIQQLRLPRAIAGALVGAAFAVAGAIMQGVTRNPLSDPGILGINAGAGFMLALCFAFLPQLPFHYVILFSFLGAAIGTGLVYGISAMAKGGVTPVRIVLAGSAVSALLLALSEGIAIYYHIGQDLAFWFAGGVAGTKWLQVSIMAPWILVALGCAILISPWITLLSMGEDVATGLGLRIGLVKLAAYALVLILAGAAVSTVGAIGFIGLIIPHIVRYLVGVDYRWIIPTSAVMGALLVVGADIGARMINPPFETPIGALISLIGVPFFLYLARRKRRD